VDDSANWEFAAVVAAVCIGLGGLLLFTLVGAVGAWRVYEAATRAAAQTARAAGAIEELARSLTPSQSSGVGHASEIPAPRTDAALAGTASELERLRAQAADLLAQQSLLQDAIRNLVEAGVLRGDESNQQLRDLEQTLRRVEEHLVRITTPGAR
jgi:hypothetical protein